MGKIEDDEAVLVCVGAFEADTLATRLAGGVAVVHSDVHTIAGRGVDETIALGDIAVDIVYVSVGGIRVLIRVSMYIRSDASGSTYGEKVELVEEATVGAIIFMQAVLGRDQRSQAQSGQDGRENVHCQEKD